ncbi:hypothetical protein [Maribacter sp. 2304DJ31-5]|uniref:hypothetical protein n=1 Tax=Maribacter sp. 2304DJ31-5 TaxID=3386273 RepID=UPI0039BD7929
MKNIKIVIISILLSSSMTELIAANSLEAEKVNIEQISLAEQVYSRLVVSTRIVKFTNKYIDSQKQEKPHVPDNIWVQIKNSIDYNIFKNGAIEVLNNNLSNQQMQNLINDFSDKPSIPISNLIKKELYDLMPNFQGTIDQKISQILSDNGY